MQCSECGKHLRLNHKVIEVDTLKKEYFCKNGHKTIYRRYGKCVEINGAITYVDKEFDLSEANRLQARNRRNRALLQKATTN